MSGFVAVFVALSLLAGQSVAAPSSEEHLTVAFQQVSLADVCANRRTPIIAVQEVSRMIKELKDNPKACPKGYSSSFEELEPIITESVEEPLCSDAKFEQIKNYHFRYINPPVEDYKYGDDVSKVPKVIKRKPLTSDKFHESIQLDEYKQVIMIPVALQHFFKAWALQVSGLCKRVLVENLERAVMENFSDADVQLLDEHIKLSANHKSEQATNKRRFDHLVYLPELEGEQSPGDIQLHKQKTILDFTDKPELDKFMHACEKKFKPIYGALIMPVVKLAKLGYDYQGDKIRAIKETLQTDPLVTKWLGVTNICESHGNFELVESKTSPIQMDQLVYKPRVMYIFGDDLWIKGREALDAELEAISGIKLTGLKKFKYNLGACGRRALAKIDPYKFAWYRRNQNTVSSSCNVASISSTVIGLSLTFA